MKHLQTFESFINENLNEGAGGALALKYDATIMDDFDFDEVDFDEDGAGWIDDTMKKGNWPGGNSGTYFLNKAYVEDSGKNWDQLLKDLKSKNVKHEVWDGDEDSIVLFSK